MIPIGRRALNLNRWRELDAVGSRNKFLVLTGYLRFRKGARSRHIRERSVLPAHTRKDARKCFYAGAGPRRSYEPGSCTPDAMRHGDGRDRTAARMLCVGTATTKGRDPWARLYGFAALRNAVSGNSAVSLRRRFAACRALPAR